MDQDLELLLLDGPAANIHGNVGLHEVAESGLVGRRLGQRIGNPDNVTAEHRARWEGERQAIRRRQADCQHDWRPLVSKFGAAEVCANCHARVEDPFDGGGSRYRAPAPVDTAALIAQYGALAC